MTPHVLTQDFRFPTDPDFPELATLTDPGLMLDVFRSRLRPIAGRSYHIEECSPARFRCRQSRKRCVLQYLLRVVDASSGRRWNQWVTALVYARPGVAERKWRSLQAAGAGRNVPEQWQTFEPVEFFPDLQMIVEVFPYDRRLPTLCLVMGEALQSLEPTLFSRLPAGAWRTEDRRLETTRYRTEIAAALRYTVTARDAVSGRLERLRCYVKVYHNDCGEATFRLLQSLTEPSAQAHGAFEVIRPITYMPELWTLVVEEAPGTSLRDVLLREGDVTAAVRAAARAVAAFNQAPLPITETTPLAMQLAQLERASVLVQWAYAEASAEVRAITDAVVQGLDEVPAAPIHGDLKPDHIFWTGERVVFIDLDAAVLGDPVRDAAHLFSYILSRIHLDALAPDRARSAAVAFVEEYFRLVPTPWRRRFSLHCAGALIEVAGALFRSQEPQWAEKVSAAIVEARRALTWVP
jgi:hypothetical protein